MNPPLLKTKLFVPSARPEGQHVSRPHLVERLNAGLHRNARLTLISAPAGFGKTTLLAEWVHSRGVVTPLGDRDRVAAPLPVAWLSLDDGDNDPIRFLSYFIAALQTMQEGVGSGVLGMLQATPAQASPMEHLLIGLINDIANIDPFLLVLDDYHLITSRPIHDAMDYLLDHLPANAHLVMATRSDPPLALSRLRGRGQLTELRQADLSFSAAETAALLTRVMGLDLAADDLATLAGRTEGWVTGLQMAAVSLQGRDAEQASSFIQGLSGSYRYILDYLVEEVLQRQPAEMQDFLLQTSILDRLTGDLCDFVTGREDSCALLEQIERANLFVVPLDSERCWYRYHRLFADLLRARLEQAQAELLLVLHQRASQWYEQEDILDEAINHAQAAGDPARIAAIIEAHGMAVLMRGELAALGRWIASLPESFIVESPLICVLDAWVMLLTGRFQQSEARLQQAETVSDSQLSADMVGKIATVRAFLVSQAGDVVRTLEYANQALESLGENDLGEQSLVHFVLGGVHLLRGEVATAGDAMLLASEMGQKGGNIHIVLPALNALAAIRMHQGRLQQARTIAMQAVQLGGGSLERPLPIAAGAISALADLAYEWNKLDKALQYARQGVELGRQWGNVDTLCNNYLTLAQVLLAHGELEAAREALEQAEATSGGLAEAPTFLSMSQARWAAYWLAKGDLGAAASWADSVAIKKPDFLYSPEALALARVQLVLDRPEQALQGLAPLLAMAREKGMVMVLIEGLAVQALAYQVQGRADAALASLRESLELAQGEGFLRRFLDLGSDIESLLKQLAGQEPKGAYVHQLLAQFAGRATIPHADALIEQLSPRELDVLQRVAEGLSNREIAGQLFVAESTVKSHLNTVYRKLGVKNRTQAVAKARDLRLL